MRQTRTEYTTVFSDLSPEEQRERRREIERRYRQRHRAKRRAEGRAYYQENKDKFRAMSLRRNYGITPKQHDALFEAQGNVCGCCGTSEPGSVKGWAVDHCHETGKVRGILCQRCNLLLGKLGETIQAVEETASRFTAYLRKAEEG